MSVDGDPSPDECVPLDRGDGDPMTLISGPGTPSGAARRLKARLEAAGYQVDREYVDGETQAYLVAHPGFDGGDRA